MNRKYIIPIAYILLVATTVILLFTSCKNTEYVTRVETVYKTDTVSMVDSVDRFVVHYEYIQGDTVRTIDSVNIFKYINRYVSVRDTVRDTASIPVEVVSTVYKNKPQWWPVWLSLGLVIVYWKRNYIVQFMKRIINLFKK